MQKLDGNGFHLNENWCDSTRWDGDGEGEWSRVGGGGGGGVVTSCLLSFFSQIAQTISTHFWTFYRIILKIRYLIMQKKINMFKSCPAL